MLSLWRVTLGLSYEYENETTDGGETTVDVSAKSAESAIKRAKEYEGDGESCDPEPEDDPEENGPYVTHATLLGVEKTAKIDCSAAD